MAQQTAGEGLAKQCRFLKGSVSRQFTLLSEFSAIVAQPLSSELGLYVKEEIIKTFGIAIWCIALIIVILIVLLSVNIDGIDGGDIVYSMLSGASVSFFVALVAMFKNLPSSKILLIVFFSILSAAGAWIVALIFLYITNVSLYSNTALAFDLTVGIIGAIAMSSVLIEKYTTQG